MSDDEDIQRCARCGVILTGHEKRRYNGLCQMCDSEIGDL
jgi:ribosomal protein S27AE